MTDGRVSNGQFAKGNQEWRKRKRNGPQKAVDLEALHEVIDASVSQDAVEAAWKRVEGVMLSGSRGWLEFFKLYLDRRYGKPDTYQELDITTGGEPLKGYMVVSPDDWPSE